MSVLSWLSPKVRKMEQEKKELKVELTQALMRLDRRSGEIKQVASDVITLMHRRREDRE